MKKQTLVKQLNIKMMAVPIITVLIICGLFLMYPASSSALLGSVRSFIDHHFIYWFLWLAVIFFVTSIVVALSKYGTIKLGNVDQPQYNTLSWGTMIFTSTMSADVIFYSLCEWSMYGSDPYIQSQKDGLAHLALTYSLFHWGPLAWGFYIMLAVAFGYIIYVKNNQRQKISEACRPVLHHYIDKLPGRMIDYLAIIALLAGTATTFSMSMPLLSTAVSHICNVSNGRYLSAIMLVVVALIYTSTILFGTSGIAKLSKVCSFFFVLLILYFFFGGQERFIVQNSFRSLTKLCTDFVQMAVVTHPQAKKRFMIHWTVYYWSYWMVWSVATPFFIGMISKGRTIRNVVFGGYFWGLSGTYISFLCLGNYGLRQQLLGNIKIIQLMDRHHSYAQSIIEVFQTFRVPTIGLILLVITMIGLYSTVFDSITMVVSSYSYKQLRPGDEPNKAIRIFWALIFILLPLTFILTGESVYRLQSVAIIAALPISFVFIIILISFLHAIRH